MNTTFRSWVVCTALLMSSGCTIIPGLQIHAPERYGNEGATMEQVSENEQIHHLNQKDGAINSIRIVTLNNKTLADINKPLAPSPEPTAISLSPLQEYVVGPGDVVNVVVWDHPELTSPSGGTANGSDINAGRLIDAQGYMFYPYAGTMYVAGLTVSALRNLLINRLSKVIQNPQIDVRVASYRSRRVQVSGHVREPGMVVLDDTDKGILEAINERGGLGEAASRRFLELTRDGNTYKLNAQSVVSRKGIDANLRLIHGDVIFVPDRSEDQIFVLGSVKREGPIYMESQRTTLVQVLAAAEGLDRISGDDSGVLIFRKPLTLGQAATVIKLDLGSPLGLLLASEIDLQPRDIVYVAATDFSRYNAVINQLLPTISAVFQTDALVRRIGGN